MMLRNAAASKSIVCVVVHAITHLSFFEIHGPEESKAGEFSKAISDTDGPEDCCS